MSITVGTIIAATVAARAVYAAVQWLREIWGNRVTAPNSLCTANMSEMDEKMQEETIRIIKDIFGEDINENIQELSASDRILKIEEFAKRIKLVYGLDVDINFYGDDKNLCGFYSFKDNELNLNVADLLSKNAEDIYEFLDTVIHEMRHAVQWKAVQEEGFWNVDDKTRAEWMDNLANNYIPFNVDPRGYALQPVEVDARTFATGCLEGVIGNGQHE